MREIVLAIALTTFGCSSTSTTVDSGLSDASDATTKSDSADDAATGLLAPTIVSVIQMTGGLHVTWTNNQKDCDAIEGERKSDAESYKLAFTVPDGSVDNKHDGPLTVGTTYTYRVRCKKGGDYSSYSNEMTGTP